ncbi:E3 ubiquitin ligase TRAF3IP2 [Ctenopharyngodon idella]|uniref:E3 ubiquitin ligase TRAF3IP2 n=1 Tax=Ctenopharyngodon idella TaxID=7959 RepID=UPI00222F6374|nr:E3 ubiquitin ligase TRAF3IP2 [Ctenopharyngodon idella]XP_051769403.1 E3 ubiquitin ligase TRAF3IP2 [Ctenopharyngodon idella]
MAHQYTSLNCPEENDETRSEEFESDITHNPNNRSTTVPQIIHQDNAESYSSAYAHQTPYPSWDHHTGWPSSGSPHSLPSCLPSAIYHTLSESGSFFPSRPHSLPGSCSPSLMSLEHPRSLHSFPPSAPPPSYPGAHLRPQCFGQYHPPQHHMNPIHYCSSRPGHQLPYRPSGLTQYRQVDTHFSENGHASLSPRQNPSQCTHLSQEQRKVFVTYEADSEEHLKEIIKFVALLRNNGFDTHIDVFEQQLNSISKIDCMERYLNEKDYLIIIIISLRYYETISGINISMDSDERTSNTVYIHRQLQSEFIQNGCRNYRFIPILFPGAKKSYVPTWLQNTYIYSWPKDRDDILRRLMRVEKYRPPPIGPLPKIVSIPLS